MTTLVYRNAGAWGSGKGALLTSTEVDTNFYNLDQGKLDRIDAGKSSAVQSPNLLANSTGENGNLGWNSSNFAGGVDLLAGGGYRFANGAAITSGASVSDESQKYTFSSGANICISAEVFTGSATAGNANIVVKAYDASNTLLGTVAQTTAVPFGQGYKFSYGTGVTPSNTSYVTVSKVASGNPLAPIGGFQFRRIKLEPGTSPSTWSQEASIASALQSANNLSDVANKTTARANLGAQGKILLGEVILTGSATSTGGVDFDGLFTSEFVDYELEFSNMYTTVNTAHDIGLRWKRAGAVLSGASYVYGWQYINNAPGAGQQGSSAGSYFQLANGQNDALIGLGQAGTVRLHNPLGVGGTCKHVRWDMCGINGSTGVANYHGSGFYNADTNAFSGIQLFKSAGVQTLNGIFRLYGIA